MVVARVLCPMSAEKRRQLRRRILDLMREVGTLLIAFSPLDAALEYGRGEFGAAHAATAWVVMGFGLFVLALGLEWIWPDV